VRPHGNNDTDQSYDEPGMSHKLMTQHTDYSIKPQTNNVQTSSCTDSQFL